MMDHSFFTDRLSAYMDQELKHEELVIVEEHIRQCDECQAILKRMEQFTDFVIEHDELGEAAYWEANAQKIEQTLGIQEKTEIVDIKPKKSWQGLGWKLTAVAASVVILVSIGLYRSDIMNSIETIDHEPETQQRDLPPLMLTDSTVFGEEPVQKDEVTEANELKDELENVENSAAKEQDAETQSGTNRVGEQSNSYLAEKTNNVVVPGKDSDKNDQTESKTKETKKATGEQPQKASPYVISNDVSLDKTIRVKAESDKLDKSIKPTPQRSEEFAQPSEKKTTEAVDQDKSKEAAPLKAAINLAPKIETQMDKVLTADTTQSLEYWRSVRDSLTEQLNQKKVSVENLAAKDTKESLRSAGTSKSAARQSVEAQKLGLIESYYKVASLTEDKEERQTSIFALEAYAAGKDKVADKAQEYLDKLDMKKKNK